MDHTGLVPILNTTKTAYGATNELMYVVNDIRGRRFALNSMERGLRWHYDCSRQTLASAYERVYGQAQTSFNIPGW